MDITKKDGGILKNWQTHTLSVPLDKLRELRPDVKEDKAMVLTGTVVEDPTGRWQPGFHMRSSLIIELDRESGMCETDNTIYRLQGTEGGDMGDLGDMVLSIFY